MDYNPTPTGSGQCTENGKSQDRRTHQLQRYLPTTQRISNNVQPH